MASCYLSLGTRRKLSVYASHVGAYWVYAIHVSAYWGGFKTLAISKMEHFVTKKIANAFPKNS